MLGVEEKRRCIDETHPVLSIRKQCELLDLSRSTFYYEPCSESSENLALMAKIDRLYTDHPCYGSRRIAACLREMGFPVNRKRIQRLMRLMGLEAIHPKPKPGQKRVDHKIYPYLLRNVPITHPNHVWSTDITYIPMRRGFMYLAAIIDWHSRYVLSWRISNTLDGAFCRDILVEALEQAKPEIFNTDQGVQFTSPKFTDILKDARILISMDGRGRALDNVYIERLWRTVKYEHVYLHVHDNGLDLLRGLEAFFNHYNTTRPHQSLNYRKPADVYHATMS